ncbi:MAG: hypothetical protein J7L78_03410 [Dehalococcoidales bacterium]|nr:hypothetical protein [Dehalococcoidales bacterium]
MDFKSACDQLLTRLGYGGSSASDAMKSEAARLMSRALERYWEINRDYYREVISYKYSLTSREETTVTASGATPYDVTLSLSSVSSYLNLLGATLVDANGNRNVVRSIASTGVAALLRPNAFTASDTLTVYQRAVPNKSTLDYFTPTKCFVRNEKGMEIVPVLFARPKVFWGEEYELLLCSNTYPSIYTVHDGYVLINTAFVPSQTWYIVLHGWRRPELYDAYPSSSVEMDAPEMVHYSLIDYAQGLWRMLHEQSADSQALMREAVARMRNASIRAW